MGAMQYLLRGRHLAMPLLLLSTACVRPATDSRASGSWTYEVDAPAEAACRTLVERYVRAFEAADIDALTRLLTDDVVMEMPPILNWFRGRHDYGQFIARSYSMRGRDWRMIPMSANGQPACVAYTRAADGVYRLHTLQVFTVTPAGISRNTVFQDDAVFAIFALPPTLPDR